MSPKNAYFQTWKPLIESIKNFKFTNIFVYQQTLLTYTPVSHACTGLTLKAVGRSICPPLNITQLRNIIIE